MVRTVIYVVSGNQAVLADVWTRFTASVISPAFTTASTLLGVTQLGFPGQLVELDHGDTRSSALKTSLAGGDSGMVTAPA